MAVRPHPAPRRVGPTEEELDAALVGRLRLRHLSVLLAVADARSMKRAAARVHLTQPGITRLVQEAEEMLATPLFERGRRGVAPTPAGEVLLSRARSLLTDVAATRREVAAIAAGAVGRVRLGVLPVVETDLLPRALLRLRRDAPRLGVVVEEGAREVLTEALRRGSLDLVVGRLSPSDAGAALAALPLFGLPVAVVCGAGHRLARARRAGWERLAAEEWVLPPAGTPVRAALEARFHAAGLAVPRAQIESASVLTNLALLADSPLLAVMPLGAARVLAEAGALCVLPVRLEDGLPPVGVLMRDGAAPSSAAAIVLDTLRLEAAAIAKGE